jgi:hypothetical protein
MIHTDHYIIIGRRYDNDGIFSDKILFEGLITECLEWIRDRDLIEYVDIEVHRFNS